MSTNGNPYKPVPVEQAENITQQLVTPMLMLSKYELQDGELKVDQTATIKCLFYWQSIITAITMRQHSQSVLEYLMKIRSIDTTLIDILQKDILVADDNINFMNEKLAEYGIKL